MNNLNMIQFAIARVCAQLREQGSLQQLPPKEAHLLLITEYYVEAYEGCEAAAAKGKSA